MCVCVCVHVSISHPLSYFLLPRYIFRPIPERATINKKK